MDDQPIQDPTWRLNAIDDPEERYKALGKDAKASVALRNIATYFVKSNRTGYPSNNTETITVGTLDHAEAERQFAARFDFDDILDAYNAIDGQRSDLPRRTHRHHGRARRRLAGNRHERPAHRTPVGQNRPS